MPWRDLSVRFGDWKNVDRCLRRWCESGVIERIFRHLAADHANDYMMLDSTIVRTHQHSAGARKKRVWIRHRAIPWWADHKSPCRCRCRGKAGSSFADARAKGRHH
ncbi:hypothetical protein CFR71_00035 [Novacetimonas pomaceti]|uniref:Transposase n=1 Tax=Novacetimonas pomaceti TaxID=2021998 RepID=A0A318QHK2_9PROT|nr:hypothetical protein CFR71_00035 [Novacetimonas pomaceti]